MQIHDLNEKTLTNPAYVAFDDGTDTYKADFKAEIDNAAASAVADADLTDNTVAFTSGDAESPTTWTAVSVLTSGLTIKVLFNRISTMIKNVRYIWNLLGSSSFSNVASTLTGAIGNTALTTTAQTLSGAIAEHERDISGLNSNLDTVTSNIVYSPSYCYAYKKAGIVYLYGHSAGGLALTGDNAWHSFTTLPVGYRPRADIYFVGATAQGIVITFHVAQNGNVEYITSNNTSYWNYGGSFPI